MRAYALTIGFALIAGAVAQVAAAPTAIEDCGPDQLPRDLTSVSRSDIERRCTHVIAHGGLGPFLIGEDKQQVLETLRAEGIHNIALVSAYRDAFDVTDGDAEDLIRTSEGILVRAGDLPDPLRIEFAGPTVVHVFGGASELATLRAKLAAGQSRDAVITTLRSETRRFGLKIEAYVPQGETVALPLAPEARRRVLGENHWRFDAAPALCGFEAFYSQVELIFEGDRLVRLEHFCFPFELP